MMAESNLCTATCEDVYHFTSSVFSSELLQNLNKLFVRGLFCDVKLELSDGRTVSAHRNILCAASPYFHAMFVGGLRETRVEKISLEHIAAPHIVTKLIEFIYTGCIDVNSDIAQDLLEAADMLQLTHVVDACCNYLKQQLHESNSIGIYLFADAHSCLDLRTAAESFILANFIDISAGDEFLTLPLDALLRFLRSDELRVETEYQVLEAGLRWLHSDALARRRHVYDVLGSIRLSVIPLSLCDRSIGLCTDLGVKIVLQKLVQDLRQGTTSPRIPIQPRRHSRRTIYVIGGYCRDVGARWGDSVTLSRVDCYDTFLHAWQTVPPLRSARSGVAVASLNGVIYAIGGESDSLIFDSVERFDLATSSRWHAVEPMTVPRCGAGVCAFDGLLYVFGGWVGAEIGKSVEIYDSRQNTWSLLKNFKGTPRYALTVTEYKGLVYLIGGLNEVNSELGSVDVFDPVCQQCTPITDMHIPRAYAGSAAIGGFIYVVGGWNEREGALPSVEQYSVDEDIWTFVSPLTVPRAGVCVAAVNGHIYAVGGRTSSSEYSASSTLKSVECYSPENDEWLDAGVMPSSRCDAGIAVI